MAAAVSAQQCHTRTKPSSGLPSDGSHHVWNELLSCEHMMGTMLKKCPKLCGESDVTERAFQRRGSPGTTHITELHHADLPQLADATVGRLRLQEELSQRHFFASEELPHGAAGCESSPPGEPLQETDSL